MPVLKGTLDVLVLKALSWTPMHGFEILTWIEERSAGRVVIEDAALLQSLHRMEERGHVESDWGLTKNSRRARYYKLTAAGRAQLRAETARLLDDADALITVLETKRT